MYGTGPESKTNRTDKADRPSQRTTGSADIGRVVALRSDPAVFTQKARELVGLSGAGVEDTGLGIAFADVLEGVEASAEAVVLLLPVSAAAARKDAGRVSRDSVDSGHAESGSESSCVSVPAGCSAGLHWFAQRVSDACGYYALLHVLCNGRRAVPPPGPDAAAVARFVMAWAGAGPQEGAAEPCHEAVDSHFIAYVEHADCIWELDGRFASGPRCIGPSRRPGFMASEKCIQDRLQYYVSRAQDRDKWKFALLALHYVSS